MTAKTFWEYLDRNAERRARLKLARAPNIRLLANVIGCSLVSGFLGSLAALFVIPIPPENKELIIYMLGQLSGFAGGIVAYHYTSKAGEKELDEQRASNTGKMADAIKSALQAAPGKGGESDGSAAQGATAVADAAVERADEIKDGEQP